MMSMLFFVGLIVFTLFSGIEDIVMFKEYLKVIDTMNSKKVVFVAILNLIAATGILMMVIGLISITFRII